MASGFGRTAACLTMNLALFDFDGTITIKDTFSPFVRSAVRPGRMIVGTFLFIPIGLGYTLGCIPASRARPVLARLTFQGVRAAAVNELGLAYAHDVLPGLGRQCALDRIEWHRSQGDAIVVVSASLDLYLRHWCESLRVDLICTQLEERNGVLTGRYVGGDCSGAEKMKRILARYDLASYSRIYAYGDTEEDREMLNLADTKYYRWKEIDDRVASL